MVKKNTIIMSRKKYIKKLSYAYTGKLDEEIFCVSNNAYHHKVFILDEKSKIKQCYDSCIGNINLAELGLGWIFFKSYWSPNEIRENYKNTYKLENQEDCEYIEVSFINPIKFSLLKRIKAMKTKGGYRYTNNMPVQIKFLDKGKNIMAKINFNDYGIPEFDDFKQIK